MAAQAALALAGIGAIGQIQNARFQADLTEANNKQRSKELAFNVTERELELERNRLNIAIEERDRMRAANKTMANLIAKPLTANINPVLNNHLADLVDDLNIMRTEEQIMTAKSQAGSFNLLATTYAQNSLETAAAKATRQAAIIGAVSTMASAAGTYSKIKPSTIGAKPTFNNNALMGGSRVPDTRSYISLLRQG